MNDAPDKTAKIIDRMQDCGDGRHVGWWMHPCGLEDQSLFIEVKPETVTIACCEGPRAEKRIHFFTSRDMAEEITRALMKALDLS